MQNRHLAALTFTAWVLALGCALASCKDEGEERPAISDAGKDAAVSNTDAGNDASTPPRDAEVDAEPPAPDTDSGSDEDAGEEPPPPECDADADGYASNTCGGPDCDDTSAGVSPSALEVCDNGIDDDCNPGTGDLADNDFDRVRCELDCNDADPNVSPRRAEVCDNGVDDDCDPATTDRFDGDADGSHCGVDCDDDDPSVAPTRTEVCLNAVDDDCDESTVDRFDSDADGVPCDVDCDDADGTVPNSTGLCGGVLDYYEGFESGLGGWTPDASGVWRAAMPNGDELKGAASGDYALFATGEDGYYPNNAFATVISPPLDMSALSADPVVSFKMRRYLWTDDLALLESSIDGGATWQRVNASAIATYWYNGAGGTVWRDDQPTWVTAQTLLAGVAGHADVRLRFVLSTNGSSGDDGIAIDELRIRGQLTNVVVANLTGIASGCGARDALAVQVQLTNLGNEPLTNLPVSYRIDDGAPIDEQVAGPIAVGATVAYTFAAAADLSAPGMHRIEVSSAFDADADLSDNQLAVDVRTYPVVSLPYASSFESDEGGWTASGTLSSWERGQPIGDQIIGASDGQWAWVTNADGVTDDDENSFLTSPCFDLSDLTVDPVLLLDFAMAAEGLARVEISTDDGASFAILGGQGTGSNWYNSTTGWAYQSTYGMSQPWRAAEHRLLGAAGDIVQLRVHYIADDFDAGFAVDDVQVVADFVDAEVTSVVVPQLLCADQDAQSVSVTVRNNGNHALNGYDVSYRLDGGGVVTDAISTPLAVGASATHLIATPFDASGLGNHALEVWVTATSDFIAENDLVSVDLQTHPRVSALDYVESFEASNGGWFTSGAPANQWQWGMPEGPQLTTITAAGDGDKLWTTRLYGAFLPGGTAYLTSPCLDFSDYVTDPSVRFLHANDTGSGSSDFAQLEASVDGRTWTRVGTTTSGGLNWYNFAAGANSGWRGTFGWRTAQHPLAGTAGQEHVFLRYAFTATSSSNNSDEGTGVDLVMIANSFIDLGVEKAQLAPEGCENARPAVTFSVDVRNVSTTPVSNFTLTYSVDGGPEVEEPVAHVINAGAVYTHTFAGTLNLSSLGSHDIQVVVSVPGVDVNATNDITTTSSRTLPIVSVPYAEEFETNDGGWNVSGVNATWEHGVPAASNTFIVPGNSDGKIWVTNLDGNYVNNEYSYLASPCFDFSAATNDPALSFDLIYRTESNWDGTWVQVSLDGGTSWSDLGTMSDPGWYTAIKSGRHWWSGTSPGNAWATKQHALTGAAGLSAVRLRFVMQSDSSSTYEGVGIDNVTITPAP